MMFDITHPEGVIRLVELLLAIGSVWSLFLSTLNVLWLRLAGHGPPEAWPQSQPCPRVSVLVPARNEADTLGKCLESLVAQTYPNYEIVVLDDESTDRTWEVMSGFAERHPGVVRAIRGAPLPQDWCGKAHAMQQLAQHATGDFLYFTDADTQHHPHSISWAVTNLVQQRADLLSGFPHQELASTGEALVVPVLYFMTALVVPLPAVRLLRAPGLTFAVGQIMVFRRRVFDAIGGYACVKNRITEDLAVARAVKAAGYRMAFLDARSVVRCRMYTGYRAAVTGISKNIYDTARNNRGLFAVGMIAAVGLVLLPPVMLGAQLLVGLAPHRALVAAVSAFVVAWTLTLVDRGHPWWMSLVYPVFFLHVLYMAWCALRPSTAHVGLTWKGRVLR